MIHPLELLSKKSCGVRQYELWWG